MSVQRLARASVGDPWRQVQEQAALIEQMSGRERAYVLALMAAQTPELFAEAAAEAQRAAEGQRTERVVSGCVLQKVTANAGSYGLASEDGTEAAYVLWRTGARRGTDADPKRDAWLGQIWKSSGPWQAILGDGNMHHLGEFPSRGAARTAPIEAAAERGWLAPPTDVADPTEHDNDRKESRP
jgi:hypothetical protein